MKVNYHGVIIQLLISALCLLTEPDSLLAQFPELHFKHLNVEDGLSQSTVRAIFQDKMGFMWFGTDIGINKFDGSEFTVYKYNAADSTGIPSNFIIEILEDSHGIFWIGTGYGGLCRFDREQEVFYTYGYDRNNKESLSNNSIRALFEDSRNNLWIGTAGGGLNMYNRSTDSFTRFRHDSLSTTDIGSNYISAIAEDKKGFLWLASPEGILTRYSAATHKGECYNLYGNEVTDRQTTTFGQLFIDSQDDVWFATELGLYYFDQQKKEFKHFTKGTAGTHLNENAISDIQELENGIFMIATDHGGINLFNKNTGTFTYHKHSKYDVTSISNDQLYSIYRSQDGIIWIGNFHGGLNIYDPASKKFALQTELRTQKGSAFSNGSVLTICEDPEKNILFGYDGQGINVYNPQTGKIRQMTAVAGNPNSVLSNNVVEIYQSRNGDLWIGTYLMGMTRIDAKTKQFSHYRHNDHNLKGIGGNNVWSIIEDHQGKIWIGFQGNGMDSYDPKTNRFVHYKHDPNDIHTLSNNDIYKIFEDRSGNIWISTRNGLCLYNRKSDNFTRYISGKDINKGIYGNCIYDIYQDDQDSLWIGTDQALNLFHAESESFTHFLESDGLNGNAVLSITGDKNNNLWISTNKGISRFNTRERKFRNYDVADGLIDNEFNYVSVLNGSDGRMYFGAKNGFNFFYPDSIFDNPVIPPVFITGLKILNDPVGPKQNKGVLSKHITFEKNITLTSEQSVFSIEFAALNYSNPQKNQYAYWLEGFDEHWNYAGNKHEVTYTNLNPGRYTFRVKGSNNDGIWNEEGATLLITILPPWWNTWWFKVLVYATLLGLLLLFYFFRLNFYQRQQKKLLVLVRERTFQLEEVAVTLEEKQEEINSQNEKLISQRDELESNNRTLTEQKKQILEQNKELDKHRNQLESLVEERTRELIEAKNKAEESDRLKSSFLANLSHEIRTPLNAILGFSSLLGEKNLKGHEREEYNRIIQGSSNTLLELISDILDISKIEAGQLVLDSQDVALETVINDLVGIFEMFMKREDIGSNKSVELKVAIDDELRKVHIITDNLRLTQVLSNLINNAIKFTRKGSIEVGCTKVPDEEMLEFYVKDTGVGIRKENQQLVFERFRKVEEDKLQLHRGTGLGLAISYQLVNLMGGSMRLVSKFGEGSTFYFTLPLIRTESEVTRSNKKNATESTPDLSNYVILVAEDDISNFNYIDKLLKNAKATVLHAENGNQVIKLLQSNDKISLVLMDIKMPIMDGIEALHAIRKLNMKIPVIAQTAYALADEIVKLKKEGFDEYLSKPIQCDSLYEILIRYLN